MHSRSLPLWATRLTFALFCSNFLSMMLMNALRVYTHWLPALYAACMLMTGFWSFRSHLIPAVDPTYLSSKELRWLAWLVLGVAVVFAGVRAPYLLEGSLHHLVGAVGSDDLWHFQEINSLVNSVRFPAQCSLIPTRYFSLYYAPWMMIAALYLAIPIHGFTVKAAFAIGCAIYQVLFSLTLLHIGIATARTRRHLYWAIYLIGFWAGIESIFSLMHPLQDSTYWMINFGMLMVQFSSYSITAVWVVHHFSAAVALILCWHLWNAATKGASRETVLGCSLLICCAFYSSIFVFLGAMPLGIFAALLALRKNWRRVIAIIALAGAMIGSILWLYLGKAQVIGFQFPLITKVQFHSKHLARLSGSSAGIWIGFLVFLILLFGNFLPQFLALIFRARNLDRNNLVFVAIAIAFLISTYFIGFLGARNWDNYSTRGSIIPLIALTWISARLLPGLRISALVAIALFLGAFGSIQEEIQTYRLQTAAIARTAEGGKYSQQILAINQDRSTRTVSVLSVAPALADHPNLIYLIEKFVPGGKHPLVTEDRELECLGPRGIWRWQQIPEISTPK